MKKQEFSPMQIRFPNYENAEGHETIDTHLALDETSAEPKLRPMRTISLCDCAMPQQLAFVDGLDVLPLQFAHSER